MPGMTCMYNMTLSVRKPSKNNQKRNTVISIKNMMGIISSNPYQSKSKHLQLSKHLVALSQEDSSVVNQLVDDGLGRLLVVNDSGSLTHQVRTGVVNSVVVNIIR